MSKYEYIQWFKDEIVLDFMPADDDSSPDAVDDHDGGDRDREEKEVNNAKGEK